MNRRTARIALAVFSPIALFGAVEIGLRVLGFSYAPPPIQILIGDRDPIRIDTELDPDLFWTMRRGTSFERYETRFEINTLGTRGALPAKERAAGTFRVVCLGDSTAFGNHSSYPKQLQDILKEMRPDLKVEVINAGIPGFSSWQGLRFFERDLKQYKPDLVTWCFGFNNAKAERDGKSDATRGGDSGNWLDTASRHVLRLRLAQAIKKAIDSRRSHGAPFNPNRSDLPPRVSPAEHRTLLSRAASAAEGVGAMFLAITQPHALLFDDTQPLPVPAEDGSSDQAVFATLREQRRRLDAQNYAVRAECNIRQIPLLDLATQLRDRGTTAWCLNPWPGTDSIHPNPLGARYYAEQIARSQRALLGVVDPAGVDPKNDDPTGIQRTYPVMRIATPSLGLGASAIVPWAADRDGDDLDEVLCAINKDSGVDIAWWDPRTRKAEVVHQDTVLEGSQIVSLSVLPTLDEILITTRLSEGRVFVATRKSDGAPGRIPGMVAPVPGHSAHLIVEPFDLDGDDRDEYLVSYGPAGPNQLLLLSDKLRPLGSIKAGGGRCGPWIRSGRILSEERDHALITFQGGSPEVRTYGSDRRFQRWIRPTLGLARTTSRLAPGRYHPDSPIDGIALSRGAAVAFLREDGSATEPTFPFGAVRADPSLPEPGGVVSRRETGPDDVLIAMRIDSQVRVIRVRNRVVSEAFQLDLPK